MQNTRLFALFSLCLAAAACSPDTPNPRPADGPGAAPTPVNSARAAFLRNVPEVPGSRLTDTTGAEDAQRASYAVLLPLDTVRMFYVRLLPALGWRLRSDQSDSTVANLYLEKDSSVLWIRATPQGAGTAYTMIGSYNAGGTAAPAPAPVPARTPAPARRRPPQR